MNWWYEFRFLLERIWKKLGASNLKIGLAKFRMVGVNLLFGWFFFLWEFHKRWNGHGRWVTYGALLAIVASLGGGGWLLAKEARYRMAVWRAAEAEKLLKEGELQTAVMKAGSAYLAYPDNLSFLRLVTEASRQAKANDYPNLARKLAGHPNAKLQEVLQLTDDLIAGGDIEGAGRWLRKARELGLSSSEDFKRLLQLELLAGKAGRLPALVRASVLVEQGVEDPDVAVAYAGLCTLWKAPEQRTQALDRLQAWAEREDEVGMAALQALLSFPELEKEKRDFYSEKLTTRNQEKPNYENIKNKLVFLRKTRDLKYLKENDWASDLRETTFDEIEKLALRGGILRRLGKIEEGERCLRNSLRQVDPEKSSLVESEILSTGDLGLTIDLLLKYRQNPWLQIRSDALLIDLYRRAERNSDAEQTAGNLSLAYLRHNPNLLASAARAKILVSRDHLQECRAEAERLVAKYSHDPDFRELLGLVYHLQGEQAKALEILLPAKEEYPLKRRARIKCLRWACIRDLKQKSPSSEDYPSKEERNALEEVERELLKIKI